MTSYDTTGEYILPREITFSGINLPAKRAVSIIFENGIERSTTFCFTYIDRDDTFLVEVYWWDSDTKVIGFYGIIEELYPFEVKNPTTGLTEFIVVPRRLSIKTITENGMKMLQMDPRLWIYEVDFS